MPKHRVRIAPGIYEDASGIGATVKARGQQRERRFPKGTALRTITDWRARERLRILDSQPAAGRSSFAKDCDRYLDTLSDRPQRKAERTHQLKWWAKRFGRLRRAEIDAPMIRTALVELRAKKSASTCNKYRIALSHLWNTLDGRAGRNPLRDVASFEEPEPEPRNLPPALVARILAAIPDLSQAVKGKKRGTVSKTKARFQVMAATGFSPASLKKIRPEDLHLEDRAIYLHRRGKGKGAAGGLFPITPAAVVAFQAFIAANAFGPFSTNAARHCWQRACLTVEEEKETTEAERRLLQHARPYDLRHTFATTVLSLTGSLSTTQELLQHKSVKTTKRYARAAIPEHLRAAVDILG